MTDSINWLTKVVEVGREQDEFNFEDPARRKAISILATIQGARQMARGHENVFLECMFDQVGTVLGIKV